MSLSTMNGDGSLVRCLVERLTTRVSRRMTRERPSMTWDAVPISGCERTWGENTRADFLLAPI